MAGSLVLRANNIMVQKASKQKISRHHGVASSNSNSRYLICSMHSTVIDARLHQTTTDRVIKRQYYE